MEDLGWGSIALTLFIVGIFGSALTSKPKGAETHHPMMESLNKVFDWSFTASLWIIVALFAVGVFNITTDVMSDDEPYDDTPSEWGPGYESGGNEKFHEVDGYYNSNGTYVESYMRSDPDIFESNNFGN